ncbi:hypothetical protein GCM10010272_70130 [Streptomyces lateritius]|nr:hypothetical protein GCM10010272_70130 [Streptomyces lateritius]
MASTCPERVETRQEFDSLPCPLGQKKAPSNDILADVMPELVGHVQAVKVTRTPKVRISAGIKQVPGGATVFPGAAEFADPDFRPSLRDRARRRLIRRAGFGQVRWLCAIRQ